MSIVVFGSFVVDLTSRSAGLPLPGQTLHGSSFKYGAGGKGSNQAVAAHRAGADITLVTKIGQDFFGQVAMDFYQNEGMNTDYILRDNLKETGIALIMVDEISAQNKIVVVSGACGNFTAENIEQCRGLIEHASILLLQHEINQDALYKVIEIADDAGVRIVLNPAPAAPIPDEILKKIDLITPNETEAQTLTGIQINDIEDARRAASALLAKGVHEVIITLGSLGAYVTDGKQDWMIDSIKVDVVDTTGAGDAFNGGLVTALDEGKNLLDAARFGNVVGALSVTKIGTAPSMPDRGQIRQLYKATYGLDI